MTRRKRTTRTAQLNAALAAIPGALYAGCFVVFRPFKGWFIDGEARWFGDEGEHIGNNWRDALMSLDWLARREARYVRAA